MADSGIRHVVAAVPVPKTAYEDESHHALIHGTSFPALPVERQLYYRDDLHTWYIYNGSTWVSLQAAAIDKLDDIGDVEVPTPTDQYLLYWDAATSLWKCKKLDKTNLSQDFGASSARLSNFVPIALSRVLLLYTDSVSSTPNTALITAKGASTITVTTGKGRYYYGNPTHSEMLIWNTTRGTSAWVASRSGDVLTLTAAVPAAWQVGDTITNAYDGASSIWVKVKLLKLSATAKAISCIHYVCDSGTPSETVLSAIHFEPVGAVQYSLRTQVAGRLASDGYILTFIQNQFVYYFIMASGTNTYQLVYDVMGYWEPADA